jgi:ribosomal-protein-alanine N-acetyltransferase
MRWWDIESVHRLEEQLFPVDKWSREQFWSELAAPTRTYVVAEADSAVIGYAGLFALGAQSDVQTIAVDPRMQGTGLGSRLLWALIDAAREQGARELLLEVRSDNAPAIQMYQRFGFERISIRRDYYAPGVDAHVMRLRPLPEKGLDEGARDE